MYRNPNTYSKAIGQAIKTELAIGGKSIASLAPVLGVSTGTVYSRARGTTSFDFVELNIIADYLGTSVPKLVELAEKKSKEMK